MKIELTKEQLKEVKNIRDYLIEFVRDNRDDKRYYTTYQVTVCTCKLPYGNLQTNSKGRKELGKVLAFLAEKEYSNNRPALTSVIYGVGLYRPRNGFYQALINMGFKSTKGKSVKELYENFDWRRNLEKEALDFWRNDDNYKKYK